MAQFKKRKTADATFEFFGTINFKISIRIFPFFYPFILFFPYATLSREERKKKILIFAQSKSILQKRISWLNIGNKQNCTSGFTDKIIFQIYVFRYKEMKFRSLEKKLKLQIFSKAV